MPLILPGNVASATASTTYDVANSCRFNDGDSAYMYRSNGTPTSQRILTISTWLKRGTDMATTDVYQYWMGIQDTGVGDPRMYIGFNDSGQLNTGEKGGAGENVWKFTTNRVFRDPTAWYHIVLSIDTTQGTEANRLKIYVNGTQETSFATSTYPTENLDMDTTGNEINVACIDNASPSGFFDGYIAEMVYSDGQAYAASDFGEFDEDSPTIWKPKDVSGLTFGDNGFYLDFEDSANLGNDANGGTDFTETNLAATDQATDTPTNNFCTLNPLTTTSSDFTISEGNCKLVGVSGWRPSTATIGVTSGKWYCEAKCTAVGSASVYGIIDFAQYVDTTTEMAGYSRAWLYRAYRGYLYNNNTYEGEVSYGDGWTTDDIIGIYLDCDNNKVYWAKNGVVQNSGTGISITDGYDYTFAFNIYNSTAEVNFGNPTWSLSSAVADDNGYGSFEYDPSAGTFDSASKDFYALCTKNLAEYG